MTTHLIRVLHVLQWTSLARQTFAFNVEATLPGRNAAEAGEETVEWDNFVNRGFSLEESLVKRDGSCINGSHPCQYPARLLHTFYACPSWEGELLGKMSPNKSHGFQAPTSIQTHVAPILSTVL